LKNEYTNVLQVLSLLGDQGGDRKISNKKIKKMENLTRPKWYNKNWLVLVLCLFVFPVGLYALWKNESIPKSGKIIITVIIVLLFLLNIASTGNGR
jgi:hypothetical protein